MEVDLDTLLKEGREFFELRRRFQKAQSPEAGTPIYVINKQWIDRYKKYVFYEEVNKDMRPEMSVDHCAKNHPGPIENNKILEDDSKFLKGTGTSKMFEADVYDTYIQEKMREKVDLEYCTEEMWQFVSSRYGSDTTIKRFY